MYDVYFLFENKTFVADAIVHENSYSYQLSL